MTKFCYYVHHRPIHTELCTNLTLHVQQKLRLLYTRKWRKGPSYKNYHVLSPCLGGDPIGCRHQHSQGLGGFAQKLLLGRDGRGHRCGVIKRFVGAGEWRRNDEERSAGIEDSADFGARLAQVGDRLLPLCELRLREKLEVLSCFMRSTLVQEIVQIKKRESNPPYLIILLGLDEKTKTR